MGHARYYRKAMEKYPLDAVFGVVFYRRLLLVVLANGESARIGAYERRKLFHRIVSLRDLWIGLVLSG